MSEDKIIKNLIAAAESLLEIAETRACEQAGGTCYYDNWMAELNDARAAISMAKGEPYTPVYEFTDTTAEYSWNNQNGVSDE